MAVQYIDVRGYDIVVMTVNKRANWSPMRTARRSGHSRAGLFLFSSLTPEGPSGLVWWLQLQHQIDHQIDALR